MRKIFYSAVSAFCIFASPLFAKDEAKSDYVRYQGDDKAGKLETIVVSMKKGDVKVDLIGAVHIADKAYYAELTELFKTYEVLLFELVDGQSIKEELEGKKDEVSAKDNDPAFKFLRGMMTSLSSYFNFQYQTDGIDYRTANFVHADVSMEQFQKMQKDKGESFFTLYQKAVRAQLELGTDKSMEPKGGQLLLALLGDSSGLKVVMARSLAGADKLLEKIEGDSGTVILTERNKVALGVLEKQLAAGKKNLGIFYGAAHLADMEARMVKMGFERTGEKWITAWDIKPRARQQPKADAAK
ncbi:MAG: hypothetical protein RL088_2535 [Verrucomicrobiota bacterium]|jgi:hypothetical protein